MDHPRVELSPFHRGDCRALSGFVVSGRWPVSTLEWAQLLTLAVRLAKSRGNKGSARASPARKASENALRAGTNQLFPFHSARPFFTSSEP